MQPINIVERVKTTYKNYAFDPQIHDRFIETEQWQIILGRGLDFYYPPDPGRVHLPQSRRAKKCRIIFLPKTG
jgi:hypothetical protein